MAKKFKAGEKVWITYQGEEMEAVVIDHADNTRVWVRSHGGHGRALGYKAKDVRHKKNPTASLPRNKWVNAKIRVTSSGKIQAKVSPGALKQNPTKRKRRTKKRK